MRLAHATQMIGQLLADAREPHCPRLVDMEEVFKPEPTDLQLLDALVEAFPMPAVEMIERLVCFDFVSLRRELAK